MSDVVVQGCASSNPWPASEIVTRPVGALIPYARNARTHSEEQVAQIAASIREWGWTNPVLIDEDAGVIAGHGRLMAARKLGITEVPCIVARGWTDAQKRAYVLADNQLALNAGWDMDDGRTFAQVLAERLAPGVVTARVDSAHTKGGGNAKGKG